VEQSRLVGADPDLEYWVPVLRPPAAMLANTYLFARTPLLNRNSATNRVVIGLLAFWNRNIGSSVLLRFESPPSGERYLSKASSNCPRLYPRGVLSPYRNTSGAMPNGFRARAN